MTIMMRHYERHYEDNAVISTPTKDLFEYVDDHRRFSSHMNKSSWMMGGGQMQLTVDEGNGQKIGSHIRMSGKVFGVNLSLDEVVTEHEPPHIKTWETIGAPNLFVIGHYMMGIEVKPKGVESILRVFIDYDMPEKNILLSRLFSGIYARWCVQQMITDVRKHFDKHPY